MDGETLAMAQATIAANLHQAGGVLANLTAEVTLGGVVSIDKVAHTRDLVLGKVLYASVGIDVRTLADLLGARGTNAKNVCESDLYTLVARQVDTVNTGQLRSPLLALALLVARALANDVNLAVATNDLALVAHLLD
jgi:hypothetical protein